MKARSYVLIAIVSCLSSFGTAITLTKAAQQSPAITTQQIVVTDEARQPRIILSGGTSGGFAGLQILDPVSGKLRISVGTPDNKSSRIELRDINGNERAELALTQDMVRLSIADVDLKGGIVLGSGADRRTVLVFNDGTPTHRATFGLTAQGEANLAIYDDKGNVTWTAVPVPKH
jgi:hypothetical protein